MTSQAREVSKIITAHRQLEGGGFIVRRPLPTAGVNALDPFLLIDEMGPVDYAPGEAVGAPDHPHRGFETITYVLEGELQHEDSAGHKGSLGPGDVQWMTAGAGIVHSEEPSTKMRTEGGRVHGFQIWVNLPAKLKMTSPRYQEHAGSNLPRAQTDDGLAKVVVLAGEALGAKAVIDTLTPVVYQDWSLQAGADVTLPLAAQLQTLVYVFEGSAQVGDAGRVLADGQLGVLSGGDSVRLRATSSARLLLLAGVPLNEPIARHGPFVMNTQDELQQAVRDFQSGKMGDITRTAQIG